MSGSTASTQQRGISGELLDTDSHDKQIKAIKSSQEQERLDIDKGEQQPGCRRRSWPSSQENHIESEHAQSRPSSTLRTKEKPSREVGNGDSSLVGNSSSFNVQTHLA